VIKNFLTWQFAATAVAVMALMTMLKKVFIRAKKEHILNKPWFQAYILTPLPLILGFGIAFIPGFLCGEHWYQRAVLGVSAGFLSQFLYGVFKKRLDPEGEIPEEIAPPADKPSEVEEPDKDEDPDK
jgi:hypothetical protein